MNVVQNGGLSDGVLQLNLEKFQWTLCPVCICSLLVPVCIRMFLKIFLVYFYTGIQVNLVIWASTNIFSYLVFS